MTHNDRPRRSIIRPLKAAVDDAIYVAHCKDGKASDVMRVLSATAKRLWLMTLDQIDSLKSENASLRRKLARSRRRQAKSR